MSLAAPLSGKVAVITGASAGIGLEITRQLWRGGATVVVGARRTSRLEALAEELGERVVPLPLDVSDRGSCAAFVNASLTQCGTPDILVNNAGLARGLATVVDGDETDWREMVEANVMGLMRITQGFLPGMIERGQGDLVQVSSVAGVQPYPKGAAYCATKAAVDAFSFALRRELLGTGLRQLVIQPGMVETEFSEVRFHGDTERAKQVYRGVQPLTPQDVADAVYFAVTRPPHVSIQTLLIMPTAQVTATETARAPELLDATAGSEREGVE
ncbi:MAG: SDR family NAD(P)-dependent oxidoreductase [Polyangiaceae bacterium]|nr:SDR family NAD(P)-dependent oxidoreductase [Polyangiaceae bacterium]